MSKLIMSMSGIRGVIGDTLDPSIAMKVGKSFGAYVGKGPVIVGGDTRVSHEMVKSAVISGLVAVGTDVIDIGKVPTPTVQQMIQYYNAGGGIVVTASHNPIMWNGLKLMNGKGSFLEEAEYNDYISYFNEEKFELVSWDNVGTISYDHNALDKHIDKIFDLIDVTSIKNSKLKVLIDANNGAGAVADPLLCDRLGIEYDIIAPEPNGRFSHDPEPLEKNLSEIKQQLNDGDYDIGFVQDADADRLVMLDGNGRFIGEDYSLGVCIDYILQHETAGQKVVVNLSTSKVIEDIARQYNAETLYTKIGEINVYEGIKSQNAVVGGEGNGGVIYPKIGYGRDSLVGIVLALKYLAESKKSLADIVQTYPVYKMCRDKIALSDQGQISNFLDAIKEHYGAFKQNHEDGVKVMFEDGWLHVRASNTEPIVRLFAEAPSVEAANARVQDVKDSISVPSI